MINKRTFFAGVSTTLCKNQQFSLLRVQDFNPSWRPPVHDERCTVCGGAFRRCQQTWAETPETSILVKALRDCRLRGRAGSNYGNKHEQEHQRDLWTDLSPLKLHQEDLLPLDLSCSVWGGSWGAWRMRRGGWWKSWSDFGFRSSFQVQWITTAFFSCDGFWKTGAKFTSNHISPKTDVVFRVLNRFQFNRCQFLAINFSSATGSASVFKNRYC